MCGIFVAIDRSGIGASTESLVDAVRQAVHRGPDNIGHFQDEVCFLGHTRLAIIDLDASSNQPFELNGLVMVYNGEIFNFEELRDELIACGRSFRTGSDTEVVLQAYQQWNVECFNRFNGMWSLAIYDTRSRELLVCRDRFGQKPLFVGRVGGRLFFSSEMQQLAALVDSGTDYELILRFCREGLYESDGRTFFHGIQEFPKAHYARVTHDGMVHSHCYWHYPVGETLPTDAGSIREFERLLSDSVRLRLKADVPLGVLVSGGVDSTLIAHYARLHRGVEAEIEAFTYSSEDDADEKIFAETIAHRLHLKLHVRRQEQVPSDYCTRLRQLVRHLGRGHSSPAIVSVDYLYESVASAGVRVALDGQGADELLAGYKTYFPVVIPWYLVTGRFRQAWLALKDQRRFGFFYAIVLAARGLLPEPLRKVMRRIYGYERMFSDFKAPHYERWVDVRPPRDENGNLLNRYLIEQHRKGLENLLYYGDIVAMRSSVENRSPFMDHRLVEFSFQYDDVLKLHDAVDKYVLRVSNPYSIYRDVLDRPKIGFSSSIHPDTKDQMIAELAGSRILGWPIFSKTLKMDLISGRFKKGKFERLLFRLYQVHLWEEVFGEHNRTQPVQGVENP
jgi:asparagine synthase (glutamine-hydrolysing)